MEFLTVCFTAALWAAESQKDAGEAGLVFLFIVFVLCPAFAFFEAWCKKPKIVQNNYHTHQHAAPRPAAAEECEIIEVDEEEWRRMQPRGG